MDKKILLQNLAESLAERSGITKRKAEAFVRSFFELTEEALHNDGQVKVKGYGTTKIVNVSNRESVNINTGERFQIEGHSKVTFTPDTLFRDLVNRPFAHFTTIVLDDDVDETLLTEASEEQQTAIQEEPAVESIAAETEESAIEELEAEELEAEEPEAEETVAEEFVAEETVAEESVAEESEAEEPVAEESEAEAPEAEEEAIEKGDEESAGGETDNAPEGTEIGPFCDDDETESAGSSLGQFIEEGPVPGDDEAPEEENGPTARIISEDSQVYHTDDAGTPIIINNTLPAPRHNWWKTAFVALLMLILALFSYFAGYFRLLCPCNIVGTDAEQITSEELALTQAYKDSVEQAKADSVKQAKADSAQRAQIAEAERQRQAKEAAERAAKKLAEQQAAAEKAAKEAEKAIKEAQEATKEAEARQARVEATQKYAQIPGSNYIITGVLKTHTIRPGENLYRIASIVYGHKDFARYIAFFNNIDDPNLITKGRTIKLPKLEKK